MNIEYTDEAIVELVSRVALKRVPLKDIEHGGHEELIRWSNSFISAMAAIGLVVLFGYTNERVIGLKSPNVAVRVFFRNLEASGFLDEELDKVENLYVTVKGDTSSINTIH